MKTTKHLSKTKSTLSSLYKGLFTMALAFALASCSSDDDDNGATPAPQPEAKGTVNLNLTHVWGPSGSNSPELQLNTELTHPGTGDTLTLTMYKYYVSNVKLKKDGGGEWVEPESYRIADAKDNALVTLNIGDVPAGNYTGMKFTIGVDAERNTSGAQDGALSPVNGMFWDWNTGYIFIKVEGESPHQTGNSQSFAYHIGGFEGDNNAIRTVDFDFGSSMTITNNGTSNVNMYVNAARIWHGGLKIEDLGHIHMPGARAVQLADNFQFAFMLDGIN